MAQAFQEVLAAAGFPIATLIIDFETFFNVGYRLGKSKDSISVNEYVNDPRFEITGLGETFIDENGVEGPTNFYRPEMIPAYFEASKRALGSGFEKVTVCGMNNKFDHLILQRHFGVVPKYTVDLLDLANMWNPKEDHRLETLAKKWEAPKPKGDTNQFKGMHAKDVDWKKMEEYCGGDIDIERFLLKVMLPKIMIRPEIELPLANHTLRMFLTDSFDIDKERGKILQDRMQNELCNIIANAGKVYNYDFGHDDFSKDKFFVPMLQAALEKHGLKLPMKSGKRGMTPALSKKDQAMEELLINPIEEVRVLAEARVAVGSWPGHIKKVRNTLAQAKVRGGKLGGQLGYCRAKTWRWGGVGGINQHNMGGRGRAGRGTHPLIQEVRGLYKAPEGCVLGIVDFVAIEARNLAWQAGQKDLVEAFRTGADIYSTFATELFKAHVRKPRDTDPKPLKDLYNLRRGFGKDAILGCGFGMGTNKFYANCYINPSLRPFFDSGKYDWDFVDRLIKLYRNKYSEIPNFWGKVEKAWRFVTKFKHEEKIVNDNLRFYWKDGATYIELPSGRYIRYPGSRVGSKGELAYKYAKGMWGGYFTENIIQSESRDLLGEAILRLDQAGYWIALHVHDEVVLVLPINYSTEEAPRDDKLIQQHSDWQKQGNKLEYDHWYWTMQDFKHPIETMIEVPKWAYGLPIDAESELSERYKK